MKKRTVSVLLTTCLAAGMLAGCGSTSADTTATPDKTTEETTNETESTDASEASETADADSDYEPVTITLNLERSGLGENVEYTFTKKPSEVVASGDQMADFFPSEQSLDLTLCRRISFLNLRATGFNGFLGMYF